MFRYICEHAVDVNAVVVEKRFMVASLIVYKYFDGEYNDNGDYKWVNDKAERIKAANYYYELLTDDELSKIGKCLMNPNNENTKAIWDILWEKTEEPEYKWVLAGVVDHLDKITSEFDAFFESDGLSGAITNSPNFTAFSRLGNIIAASAMQNGYTTRLIFDDC